MTVAELVVSWRSDAEALRRNGCDAVAVVVERHASELERALRIEGDEPLTLDAAARLSGYSTSRLRHMIAAGELLNAGRKGAPRLARKDLPRKLRPSSSFDAVASARRTA